MNRIILIILFLSSVCNLFATDYFVGGPGASDSNPGTPSQPFATIQKAASVAVAGDFIKIRSGTYRETIKPVNSGTSGGRIVFQPDQGAIVVISGLNEAGNTGWTVHGGSIYKKSITLPVNGYAQNFPENTTLAANQVFKDRTMQIEARWPKMGSVNDLLDRSKIRQRNSTSNWGAASLTDNGIPNIPGGWGGGRIWMSGWFIAQTRTISSSSGSTINFPATNGDLRFSQYYYLTGKLGALTQAKEWHYENGTLYFWQDGGGSPTGVEYKARKWGFDLRGKSNITIQGLELFGCEINADINSANTIIDGIKASYTNQTFLQASYFTNALQTGMKVVGPNSIIKNSEIKYGASQAVWLGENCRAENNLITDFNWEGNYAGGVGYWDRTARQVTTRNTIKRMGRSAIDFSVNFMGSHRDMDISYNDIYECLMLSSDGGQIYGAVDNDLTGTRIHHNWIHDSKAERTPSVGFTVGICAGMYLDQASGPVTFDHNVLWNNYECDFHTWQDDRKHRNAGKSRLYNNVFATNAGNTWYSNKSYLTIVDWFFDEMRNNIFRDMVSINWIPPTATYGDVKNCLMENQNPSFSGTGQGGLAYRLNTGSIGINTGVSLPGITDGSIGTPDIGAYEYGGTNWIPGYTPQVVGQPTTVPVASISMSPATVAIAVGATSQLSKTISPSNATNQNVLWTSSNASVATVNSSGLVTAVVAGSATITATTQEGSFKATSVVTVTAGAPLVGIDDAVLGTATNQLNYTGAAWIHGSGQATFLNTTLSYSNVADNAVTLSFVGNKIEWYTEKFKTHGIAAVSVDNGPEVNVDLYASTGVQQLLVYTSPPLTNGTHTFKIRATGTKNPASTGYYAIHDFVKVYSGSVAVTGVTVSPATSTLTIGGVATVQLSKTVSPSAATNQTVLWTTSNASVATVSNSGLVTAVAAGSATITATTQDGSFKATSVITVNAPPPTQSIVGIDDAILGAATNQHSYTGAAWIHGSSHPTFLNGTLSYSNVANNTVTLSFVGNKIEWYTEKFKTHGIAAVSIDNGPEVNVDLYAATGVQKLLVYTSPALTQGTHSFKIRVTGTKNAASTGYYAIHDFVKVYSSVGGGGGGGARVASMEEEVIELQAYPNPISSGDVLHIELPDAIGALKISDMMGKSKFTSTVSETKLEIQTRDWSNGMYLLIYKSPAGMKTKKILIQ